MKLEFQIAGVEVELDVDGGFDGEADADLVERLRRWPGRGPAEHSLRLSVVHGEPDESPEAAAVPAYPGLACRSPQSGVIELSRAGLSGRIDVRGDDTTARFCCEHPNLDTPLRLALTTALPRIGGLLLHASAVATDTGAYVFSGASGAGKSTIAQILDETGYRRLTDEITLLRAEGGQVSLTVPPFRGKVALPWAATAKCAAVSFIEHGETRAEPLPIASAVRQLSKNALSYACEPRSAGDLLDAVTGVATAVPALALRFRPEPGVTEVLGLTCGNLGVADRLPL